MRMLNKLLLFIFVLIANTAYAGWALPTKLSSPATPTNPASPPVVYSDSTGTNAIAAWYTNTTTTGTINYNIFSANNWGSVTQINTASPIVSLDATLDVNSNAFTIVNLNNSSIVVYQNGTPTTLETGTVSSPHIAVQSGGTDVCAVWILNNGTTNVVRSAYFNSSNWIGPTTVTPSVSGRPASDPHVTFESGNAYAIWSYNNGTATVVQASLLIPPSSWQPATTLSSNTAGFVATHPRIAGCPNSFSVYAVWQVNNGSATIVQGARNLGSWSAATNLSSTTAGALSINPSVAIDSGGTDGAAVWQKFNGTNYYIQGAVNISNSWQSAVDLTPSSSTLDGTVPVVTMASDNALALWQQATAIGTQLQSTSYNLTDGWVTTPEVFATSRNPTNPAIFSGVSSGTTMAFGAWQFNDVSPIDIEGALDTSFNSRLSASPTTVPADGISSSTLTVLVKNSAGTPQSGVNFIRVQTQQSASVNPPTGSTNSSGIATFTTRSTQGLLASYLARNLLVGTQYGTAQVLFDQSVDPNASTVVANPTTVAADGTSASTITVTLINTSGLPAQEKEVSLAPDAGSSVITPSSIFTNSQGQAIFSVTDTAFETVTYTATDVTDSLQITQTASVTFQQEASASDSTVDATPVTVAANGTDTSLITVTLLDYLSNPVPGKTVVVSSTGSGIVTIVNNVSDVNGQAFFTVADSVAETVTLSAVDQTDNISITDTATVQFYQPVDPNNSTVVANPTTVAADGTSSSTITVTLLDGSSNPIANRDVTLSQTGSSTISPSATLTTNAQGVAVFTVTDTTIETVTYTASDFYGVVVTQMPSVDFNQQASAVNSTVAADTPVVQADGVAFSTITVTLLDYLNNPVPGKTVVLSSTGSAVITIVNNVSDGNGLAFFTVSDTVVETVTLSALDQTDNVAITQTASVQFVQAVDPNNSTVVANPTTVAADGTSSSTITVTLLDSSNNPVTNRDVTLTQTGNSTISPATTLTTNVQGVAVFTVTDTIIETVTYTATDSFGVIVTQTASVDFNQQASAPNSTVVADTPVVQADGTSFSTITVTLLDYLGSPVPGKTVVLTSTGSASITIVNNVSDANGQTLFTVSDTVAETVTISALDQTDNVAITQTASVQFVQAVDPNLSTVVANPTTLPADGTSSSTITVTLLDSSSTPIANRDVTLSQTGNAVISPATTLTTDSQGIATFTVTDTVVEVVTFTATDSFGVMVNQTASVNFNQEASGDNSTVVSDTPVVIDDGVAFSTITVTLLDYLNAPVPNKTVVVSSTGSGVVTIVNNVTDANGQAFFKVTDTVVETVTLSAVDQTDNVPITQTASVQFVQAVDPAQSTVVAVPTTVASDGLSHPTITVTLLDSSGSPIANRDVTLSQNGSAIIFPASTRTTDSQGVAVFGATDVNIETVTFTATDSFGTTVTQTAVVNYVQMATPGGSQVLATPTVVIADGSAFSTVTVTLYDVHSQPVPNKTVVLSTDGSAVVTIVNDVTDANGRAFFKVTDSISEVVNISAYDQTDNVQIVQMASVDFVQAVDPTLSSVTADPTTVPADGFNLSTITVTLYDDTGTAIRARDVTLTQGSGSSIIQPTPTMATDENGVVLFYVSDSTIESVTYTATDSFGTTVTQTATVTFNQQARTANSTVTFTSPIPADGTSFSTVTVTLLDYQNNPVPGKTVSLTPTSGSSVVTPVGTDVSDANGQVVFNVTDTVAETISYDTLDVTDNVVINKPTPVVIEFVQVPDATNSTVVASPTAVPANGTTSTITVTLLDASNNPVPNKTVSLAAGGGSSTITPVSPVSDANGVATFTVSDLVPEMVTYTATDSTDSIVITQTASVTFQQIADANTSTVVAVPTTVRANGTSFSTITVTLLDSSSNPVPGKTVQLAQNGNAQITPSSGVSDVNGQVAFQATDLFAEDVVFTATDVTDTVIIAQTPTVSFIQDVNPSLSTFTATPGQVSANGTSFSALQIAIKDYQGNPIANASVQVQGLSPNSSVLQPSSPQSTNAQGLVSFQARDAVQESVTYQATVLTTPTVTLNSTPTVNFVYVVDPGTSTIIANPTSVNANGVTASAITVTLRTINGTPVANKSVSLQPLNGSSTIAVNPIVTNSNGQAIFSVRDLTAETVTYRAVDTTDSVTLTNTASVTFLPYPNANTSDVTAFPTEVASNGIASATITVTLLDVNSQPVPGKTISLASISGFSVITPISPITNSSGVATFKVTDHQEESVTYIATDTTDNIVITQTATVMFETNISPTLSSVITSAATVPANGIATATITVTLLDVNGNPIQGEPIVLTALNGSSVIEDPPITDINGQVFFTVSDTVEETVTYIATDVEQGVTLADDVQVTFVGPQAPLHFVGEVVKNVFLDRSDLANVLKWQPSTDTSVVSYELYQNGELIRKFPSTGPYEVVLGNRKKGKTYEYKLITVNAIGIKSAPSVVVLKG